MGQGGKGLSFLLHSYIFSSNIKKYNNKIFPKYSEVMLSKWLFGGKVVPGFLGEIGKTLEKNAPELSSNVFQL